MTHKARKRFGQNFLHDPLVIQRIVQAINPRPGQRLVEIGPGEYKQNKRPFHHSSADRPRVGLALSEVVEVAVGDPGEACIALIAEARVGALTELSGSGAREGAVEAVDLGQKQDILPGIAAVEGAGRGAAAGLDASGPSELGDQTGHLRPRAPRHLA